MIHLYYIFQMKATRRNVIRLAALAASGTLGANMSGFAIETAAQEAPVSPSEPTIERLTIRRRGVGLRGYDPKRAFTGFTLFSPLPTTNKTVYLVDMLGNVAHTWNMPYPPGQSGYSPSAGRCSTTARSRTRATLGRLPTGAAPRWKWIGGDGFCGR